MTRRERLQEKYEDALFSLLMDEVATSEGEKAIEENKRLQSDPTSKVPEEADRRCRQTIRKAFAVRRAREVGHFTVKALGKVAMVAGIAAILFVGAFAASETLRVNTLNLIIEIFDESIDFHFGKDEAGVTAPIPDITAGWLPEGFTLQEQESDSDISGVWYTYRNSENGFIMIDYYKGDGTVLSVNNEGAKVEAIEINEIQATLVLNDEEYQIVWAAPDSDVILSIIGRNVTIIDLICVAENLEY